VKESKRFTKLEENGNPLYTVVGVAVILGVVAFVGIARPREAQRKPEPPPLVKALVPAEINNALIQPLVEQKASEPVEQKTDVAHPFRDPLNQSGNFSLLPYGRDAVDRCEPRCSGSEVCILNCRRLVASEFARRILPEDPTAAEVVKEVVDSCSMAGLSGHELTEEERTVVSALLTPAQLFERSELLQKFNNGTSLFAKLKRDKKDHLGEALCLAEAAITTELAIVAAAEGADAHSEMFYRRVEAKLIEALAAAKGRLGGGSRV